VECVCSGASNEHDLGAGIVIITPRGRKLCYALKLEFPATKKDAEYEAVIARMEIAAEIRIRSLCLHSDSQLIVNQILGEFQTRGERITEYLRRVQSLVGELEHYIIKHIPQEENHEADGLAKQASMGEGLIQGTIPVKSQARPRFKEVHEITLTEEGETCMTLLPHI